VKNCLGFLKFVFRKLFFLLFLSVALFSSITFANGDSDKTKTFEETEVQVIDDYEFFGLASYYNNVGLYWVTEHEVNRVDSSIQLDDSQIRWLAQVGRFNVMLWDTSDIDFSEVTEGVDINSMSMLIASAEITPVLLKKSELSEIAPELDKIRYSHLWRPLAELTKFIEFCLVKINSLINNWGVAIIVYCLLVKILLMPVSLLTARLQRNTGLIRKALTPKLAEIKSLYDGEEAHKKIMAAHKELGVGPFYSLKPLLSTLIQIPLLIATFNALGEMAQIDGSQFLWIGNLAYPDKVASLPFALPWLGEGLNLLPVLMTFVSVLATVVFTNNYDSNKDISNQKRNLYLMAAAFLILFYPFPASMVLYWMTSNAVHLIQQKLVQ